MSRPGLFACGGRHNLVISPTLDGGDLYGWGENCCGQVGDGTVVNKRVPTLLRKNSCFIVAAGRSHSLLITNEGEVLVWGSNKDGLLGMGSVDFQLSPKMIIKEGAVGAAGGWHHSLVLTEEGAVLAWGGNEYGQLGDGTTEPRKAPVKVIESGIQAVASGWYHSLALTEDGDVLQWGFIVSENRLQAESLSPGEPIACGCTAIAASGNHCLALTEDGTVLAWGGNNQGQLGDGSASRRQEPVPVAFGAQRISAGEAHSAAVTEDFQLLVWGFIGIRRKPDADDPRPGLWKCIYQPQLLELAGDAEVHSIACGGSHSLILKTDGQVDIWGGGPGACSYLVDVEDNTVVEEFFPRPVMAPGSVEIRAKKDIIASLMKGPQELALEELEKQRSKGPRNRVVQYSLADPGKVRERCGHDALIPSDEHNRLWKCSSADEAEKIGLMLEDDTKKGLNKPDGIVPFQLQAPKQAEIEGVKPLPDLIAIIQKGESDFARKRRERAEEQRKKRAQKEEEEALKKQLHRVRHAVQHNPRLRKMKATGPDRVKDLPPYNLPDMMAMLKSIMMDAMDTSAALEPDETRKIKDKALIMLVEAVWKPLLIVKCMTVTRLPRAHVPPDRGGATVKECPYRIAVLGQDSMNFEANELEDLTGCSYEAQRFRITSKAQWLFTFFGDKGELAQFPVPYGPQPLPKEETPPPTPKLPDFQLPKLLRGLAILGLGSQANAEEVEDVGFYAQGYKDHQDFKLGVDAIKKKYMNPEIQEEEDIYDFRRRIIEGALLLFQWGCQPPNEEMEQIIEEAKHQIQLRQVLREAEEQMKRDMKAMEEAERKEAGKADEEDLPEGWTKEYDPAYEEWYYWHRKTQQSQWQKPT
eukprot:TRINITY_DN41726_c0_g1_i1.p1 TRINITY_DN41726_c0_g1~~TRINITY_DN41726_c0_g1_i1.p1  ORF type:complete len:866 (-),score=248.52 TRINITY_DN41726_c0_g1_i1:143-2740(-)